MPSTPLFPLYDRIVGGNLESLLREWRAGGESFLSIRDRLLAEHEISVNPEMVRRWCNDLGISAPDRMA